MLPRSLTPPSPEVEFVIDLPDGSLLDVADEPCGSLAACRTRAQLKALTTAFAAWRVLTIVGGESDDADG
eukprot:3441353-Alexandrium_andersonii.AAC.1